MKTKVLVAAAVLLNAASLFAVRVTFVRLLPATYDLAPAERLAFIYAIGDSEQVNDFVADFIDAASRAGAYHIEHAVENNHHLVADETALQLLRSAPRARAGCSSASTPPKPTQRSRVLTPR